MPFTARQKAKCVLWFAKLESVTSVQGRFRKEYRVRKTPNYKSIMLWYRTFEETGFKIPHNYVGSKFSRPHPTRLFSLGFCEEWCVFTVTRRHWRSQRKDIHSFSKSYTSDVTSHMGCNNFTIWTVWSTQGWSCWGLT